MREPTVESLQTDIDALAIVAIMTLCIVGRNVEPAISAALHTVARNTDFPEPVRNTLSKIAQAFDATVQREKAEHA